MKDPSGVPKSGWPVMIIQHEAMGVGTHALNHANEQHIIQLY